MEAGAHNGSRRGRVAPERQPGGPTRGKSRVPVQDPSHGLSVATDEPEGTLHGLNAFSL